MIVGRQMAVMLLHSGHVVKFPRQRNRSFLAVLELHRGCLSQVEIVIGQVEPEWSGLNDFLEPQPGVKSAVEDEFEIVGRRLSNKPVAELVVAKIFSSATKRFHNSDILGGISSREFRDINCPAKERAHGHQVAQRGRIRSTRYSVIVKLLNLPRRDDRGGCIRWKGTGEQKKLVSFRYFTGPGVFLLPHLVRDKPTYFSVQRRARLQGQILPNFLRSGDRLRRITGLQSNPVPLSIALDCEPINRAAQVDTSCRFFLSGAHVLVLSHQECHIFKEKLAYIAVHRRSILGKRTARVARKTLLRRWLRVRVPPNPRFYGLGLHSERRFGPILFRLHGQSGSADGRASSRWQSHDTSLRC